MQKHEVWTIIDIIKNINNGLYRDIKIIGAKIEVQSNPDNDIDQDK